MTETEFKQLLAPFASVPADELAMTDELEAVGVDSIGIFEFCMVVEEDGHDRVEIGEDVVTLQDLYDRAASARAGV